MPVASGQGQAEPVCTYMLECCVRPDVEAATVLHVASQVRRCLWSYDRSGLLKGRVVLGALDECVDVCLIWLVACCVRSRSFPRL